MPDRNLDEALSYFADDDPRTGADLIAEQLAAEQLAGYQKMVIERLDKIDRNGEMLIESSNKLVELFAHMYDMEKEGIKLDIVRNNHLENIDDSTDELNIYPPTGKDQSRKRR